MASTYFGVQINRLHGGRVIGISADAMVEGLSATAKTTERAVVVRVVHHWGLVAHYHESEVVRIVRGGEGAKEKRREGMKTILR